MTQLNKIEVDVLIMELNRRINKLKHSNANLKSKYVSHHNTWKIPYQYREILVLEALIKKLKIIREELNAAYSTNL